MSSINEKLKVFIDNFTLEQGVFKNSLFILRPDGLLLYHNYEDSSEATSMGALLAGVWQAAESLTGFVDKTSTEGFRLSFDSTQSGIHILPFRLKEMDFYMAVIFANEINPAVLKNRLRTLKNYLIKNEKTLLDKEDTSSSETPLFENITDKEIDDLFSFV